MEAAGSQSRIVRRGLLLLRLGLLVVAIIALRRELASIDASAVLGSMRSYGAAHVIAALLFVVASFASLAAIEIMAIRYAGAEARARIGIPNAIRTSFVASAMSQTIGFAVLTGTAVRARRYSHVGVSSADTARISGFVTVTTTLGLLAAAAATLLPGNAPLRAAGVTLPGRTAGVLLALPVAAYLAWSLMRREDAHIGSFRMRRPPFPLAVLQVAVSMIDLVLTGTVLYVFLDAASSLPVFLYLRAYFVAQAVAVVSHVPGGLGVFEAGMLSLLVASGAGVHAAQIAAAIVAFRVVYYIAPLLLAAALS